VGILKIPKKYLASQQLKKYSSSAVLQQWKKHVSKELQKHPCPTGSPRAKPSPNVGIKTFQKYYLASSS
jgi:hypothetical protein